MKTTVFVCPFVITLYIPYTAFLLKISSLLIQGSFFLARVGAWVKGGVANIWPVKPFETVMVIKGYTNKI